MNAINDGILLEMHIYSVRVSTLRLTHQATPASHRTHEQRPPHHSRKRCTSHLVPQVLRRHFRDDPLYVPIMELFHEVKPRLFRRVREVDGAQTPAPPRPLCYSQVTLQTATGQFLDLTTAEPDKVDFSRFSMDT